jgi:nucleotide-binding universal stress UspA family protein
MTHGAQAAPVLETPDGAFLPRLLVATDGSDDGDRAVTFAIALAARHGSSLAICHVVDRVSAIAELCSPYAGVDTVWPVVESLDETSHAALAGAAARAEAAGVPARTFALEGDPAPELVAAERTHNCDAIVIGTQGKRGIELLLEGSTADGVLRRANVPVFVIPPAAVAPQAVLSALLVAVDDSEASGAAVDFAIRLARAEHARLTFCAAASGLKPGPTAFEYRDAVRAIAETAAGRARAAGIASDCVIVDGTPAEVIVNIARSERSSAIVIGTHGRHGLRRWLEGSVAESVVRQSPVPVAVVRLSHEREGKA